MAICFFHQAEGAFITLKNMSQKLSKDVISTFLYK
jgi:hypothetical protein